VATAIDGALTFSTLGPYLRDLPGAAGETLDLARCSRIDSAGAAYLLERTRRARARGLTLRIINANSQVLNLLRFFQLDDVVTATAGAH